MEQDSSLYDQLAANLQNAIDKKLTVGEAVLMALSGAAGEAFAVTDRRVILVREQMPILGADAEIDCFDYLYDQISTVRIEDAVGGGHLKLVLTTSPVDEKQVTLFFPSHAFNRFESAAARIRLLLQQTRSVQVAAPGAATVQQAQYSTCKQCGSAVDESQWNYCANCGVSIARVCAYCDSTVPDSARFCPRCGTSTDSVRRSNCNGCGSQISVVFAFCPYCGVPQGSRCGRCAGTILQGWKSCPACGQSVENGTQFESDRSEIYMTDFEASSADEHNALGRKLYEAENYGEAIAHFQTAIELDPRNPLYHCNLGVVFAEIGREDAALEEYQTAIGLAPNDPTPYLNLGYFHSERDNDAEARAALLKVIDLVPGTPEADEAAQIVSSLHEV